VRPQDDALTVFSRCMARLHAFAVREKVHYDLVVVARFDIKLKTPVTQLRLAPHSVQVRTPGARV
jgi:hypothetical protein